MQHLIISLLLGHTRANLELFSAPYIILFLILLNMVHRFNLQLFVYFLLCCSLGCKEKTDEKKETPAEAVINSRIKDQFIRANQQLMQKENDEMDYYAKSHKMPFLRTSS